MAPVVFINKSAGFITGSLRILSVGEKITDFVTVKMKTNINYISMAESLQLRHP